MPVAPRQWVLVGPATIANGKPQFPALPTFRPECRTEEGKVPGIYRLTFNNGCVYIGEACDLQARFDNYCSPTQGTEQEHILRDILVDTGGAEVEVIPQCDLLPKGIKRRKAEREEQKRAIEDERLLLNKCGKECGLGRGLYLRFKVEYHKKMVDEAEGELKAWNAENPSPGAKAQH
jgi:hypothetical protein